MSAPVPPRTRSTARALVTAAGIDASEAEFAALEERLPTLRAHAQQLRAITAANDPRGAVDFPRQN